LLRALINRGALVAKFIAAATGQERVTTRRNPVAEPDKSRQDLSGLREYGHG
jgi:hypothetical protein